VRAVYDYGLHNLRCKQLTISVEKCCILNIGSITVAPLLSINHTPLPVLSSNRDLGVIIAHDL